MASARVLVVDDNCNLLEILKEILEAEHYTTAPALDEQQALVAARETAFDAAIIDFKLTQGTGIALMEDLHLIDPDLPVIILTGYGSIENAVNAMKKGAFNYLTKPFDKRELLLQLESALKTRALTAQIKRLKEFCAEKYDFKNIVVHS
nr:response regulator [Deltaproteobacteria bacterium]